MEIRKIHNGFVVKSNPSLSLAYFGDNPDHTEYFCKDVDEVCEKVRMCLEKKWPPEEPKAV